MPRWWNGSSPGTHPVMFSPPAFYIYYLQGPGVYSRQSQGTIQRLPLLFSENCRGLCNVLFALSLHSHSQFLRQCSVATSYLQWEETMIMRRQMGSSSWTLISFSFIGDRCWNEFCANGNSWTTGVKFKYLAEENYHMVKVPDFGSGAFSEDFCLICGMTLNLLYFIHKMWIILPSFLSRREGDDSHRLKRKRQSKLLLEF